jgi:GTP cyclohydrolase II
MTNNPRKLNDLMRYGIQITGRIPHIIPPNPYNEFYLKTKVEKSGHLIDFSGKERLPDQLDRPIIEGMTDEQQAALEE